MAEAGSILVVEDDAGIRAMLVEYLGTHGYAVTEAGDGATLRAALARGVPDVVLLDVHLPGEDGLTLARFLRERHDVGIVMVTGASDVVDRVAGLEVGADDYVTKPFSPRELAARVKAVLRRTEPGSAEMQSLELGDLVLVPDAREVTVAGATVELTGKEFDLLAYLVENVGIVLSRDQLLDRVWGMSFAGGTRTVDVHVAQLRRKLGRPDAIRTVRGSGYKAVRA